jgi:lipopolysaccharide export system protein LptA
MYQLKNNQRVVFLRCSTILLGVVVWLWSPVCSAERADRDKPVHIESDQLTVEESNQISTFTGSVRLTQGTMQILGDKIVVKQDKEGFKHGTVYGKSASYRQKREGLDEYVVGNGERIEYDTLADKVDFYVHARLVRGKDEVSGEHITYNANTEIFQVNGQSGGAGNTSQHRVHAILQPKPREGTVAPPKPDALKIKSSDTILNAD